MGPGGAVLSEFTGKSSFVTMAKAYKLRQQEVHLEMSSLVQVSKVQGSPLTIQIHKNPSGAWRLRWRLRRGVRYSHVLWQDITVDLNCLPVAIRRHYERLNRRSEELNHIDIMLQHTIRWCAVYLGQQPSRAEPEFA